MANLLAIAGCYTNPEMNGIWMVFTVAIHILYKLNKLAVLVIYPSCEPVQPAEQTGCTGQLILLAGNHASMTA